MKRTGWHNESARHGLAAKGVKTGVRLPVLPRMKEKWVRRNSFFAEEVWMTNLSFNEAVEIYNKYSSGRAVDVEMLDHLDTPKVRKRIDDWYLKLPMKTQIKIRLAYNPAARESIAFQKKFEKTDLETG